MSALTQARIGDICKLINGKAFKPEDWSSDGLPIIRIQNLNDSERRFNYWNGSIDKQVPVKAGDVLFAWSGTPGTSFGAHIWGGPDGILNQHIFLVKLDDRRVTKRWWVHAVNNQINDLIGLAHGGVGLKHVTRRMIDDLLIPLPPLDEQKRITAILDQADELRRKRKRAIDRLNQLGQAIFHEMFGSIDQNGAASLEDVVYFQEGPGVRNWQFRDEGIKLVNVRNIVEGRLDITNTSRFLDPSEAYGKYKHFLLDEGDFVLASSGVTWGKIAEVSSSYLPLCLNTSMIRVRPNGPKISKAYLRGFIEMGSFRSQIDRLITGSAQPNFGPSHLKQVKIPVPNIVEQDRFSNRIYELRKCIDREIMQNEVLGRLFASVQNRAFRGEL